MNNHFKQFRKGIIGIDTQIPTINGGNNTILYADWTASGRNYAPIERRIQEEIMPLVANTHTETSTTGMAMTHAYHLAQQTIKKHVNANDDDIIITAGSGMTRLVNKLQRIIGFRINEHFQSAPPKGADRPIVFITHMEHHSNQTSWIETIAEVKIIPSTNDGLVDIMAFKQLLATYSDRKIKIASITSCSNVTGIKTPYSEIARLIHQEGGYCFVDFACSAPYVEIDMHPEDAECRLDAVFFSPHKFLGGPGASGVLVFNKQLYQRETPDNPGGGTVDWTNPWGEHKFIDDIEAREDGGTPAFLQTIKTAMCINLKEEMGIENILQRERFLLSLLWEKLEPLENLHILAPQHKDRLPVISFYIDDLHYNVGVKILNDVFGIQSRGGCSCAGTYGHYLLNVDQQQSNTITSQIDQGDVSNKPGWIRVSLHPTMTDDEVVFLANSIVTLAEKHSTWSSQYLHIGGCGEQQEPNTIDSIIREQITSALTSNFIHGSH